MVYFLVELVKVNVIDRRVCKAGAHSMERARGNPSEIPSEIYFSRETGKTPNSTT